MTKLLLDSSVKTPATPVTTKKITLTPVGVHGKDVTFSFDQLPTSLLDMSEYVRISEVREKNGKATGGKVCPVGDGKITMQYEMKDGSISTIDFTITAWLNKEHVPSALEAVEKAQKEAERLAHEKAKLEALKAFTPEQIAALVAAGILK